MLLLLNAQFGRQHQFTVQPWIFRRISTYTHIQIQLNLMEPKHSKRMHSKQEDKKTAEYSMCAKRGEAKQSHKCTLLLGMKAINMPTKIFKQRPCAHFRLCFFCGPEIVSFTLHYTLWLYNQANRVQFF